MKSPSAHLAALTIANDRLVHRNIELSLRVKVLEEELMSVCCVRQGTDAVAEKRVN